MLEQIDQKVAKDFKEEIKVVMELPTIKLTEAMDREAKKKFKYITIEEALSNLMNQLNEQAEELEE